jgi:rSAM/selenodomain-associated transferase 1
MQQLGVFAKFWEPGQVKTRLASAVGARRAATIYRSFLQATLSRLAVCICQRVLVYTPEERAAEFEQLAGNDWHVQPQGDGDLGQRMSTYFEAALASGFNKVVLVGSDTPTLPPQRVSEAFAALDDKSVVLGPTEDGGYYLIGLSRPAPEVFQVISWSTSQVYAQTVSQLRKRGIDFCRLPEWYDVDDKADLDRLVTDLKAASPDDPALLAMRGVVLDDRSG